jgi:hypothetical protein
MIGFLSLMLLPSSGIGKNPACAMANDSARPSRHLPNEKIGKRGYFHPASSELFHEIVGKTALDIDLGERPRWG